MNRTHLLLLVSGLAITGCSQKEPPVKPAAPPESDKPAAQAPPPEPKPASPHSPLGVTVKDIDGKDVNLANYTGRVVLVVNVASKCGYTPQYTGLESLYTSRKGKGLTVLGFPSNEFGKQEPGTEADIKAFCTDTYNVSFPMFAKVAVKGASACELYKRLAQAAPGPNASKPLGEPKWNFTKYLIGRNGEVLAKFDSAVAPDDAKLVAAVDAALAAH